MEITGKRVLMMGMGMTGKSCARFCHGKNAIVTVMDHNPNALTQDERQALEASGVRVVLGGQADTLSLDFDWVVVSPGVPHELPVIVEASRQGACVLGEIELAYRYLNIPIVAVTGTNGKTTVTSLIGEMLSASGKRVFVCGNIGTPLIDLVDIQGETDVAVVEVSNFQLDTIIDFRPHVAVLLNVAEDHLDRYPDYAAYCLSKERIFRNQRALDVAVYNGHDPSIQAMAARAGTGVKLAFRHEATDPNPAAPGARIQERSLTILRPGRETVLLDLSKAHLFGGHNRENMAAAALAALSAGGTPEGVQAAIDSFHSLDHRITPVATIRGVQYVNDSKATNIDAVQRALEAFSDPVVLILGGRDKKGRFETLIPIIKARVKHVVVMGEAGGLIAKALCGAVPIAVAGDMADAVARASEAAVPGDVVLLSPACASFDLYDSYKARGKDFRRVVEALG